MSRRFLLDVMLGKLATYLRMCGHDAAYALERGVEDDEGVLGLAREEDRVLLTRDASLAARAEESVLLESLDIVDQLRELADAGVRLELDEPARCSRCNGPLTEVGPDGSTPEYAPDPSDERVWRCVDCGQHYWRGSHWRDVERTLADL